MERKNKDQNSIFYKDAEEMNRPLSELMEELRTDITNVRGKLSDMRRSYGWDDWIEHIEGGLTCIISTMYSSVKEFERFEERQKKELQ